MKTHQQIYVLILLLLIPGKYLYAQIDSFAPVGAVWHHDATSSVYRCSSVKDTLILGQHCRKIVQKALTDTALSKYGLRLLDQETIYVYNNEDTVFLYNRSRNAFSPLYVFNVVAGDTVELPVMPAQCVYYIDTVKSACKYVVDSVKMVDYDGQALKTVFGRMLPAKPKSVGWQSWSDTSFAYAQVLGSIRTGLLPFCRGCYYTAEMDCGFTSGIRCYQSGTRNIKLKSGDCDRGFSVSVSEVSLTAAISVFPNPVSEKLSLRIPAARFGNLYIYNHMGGELLRRELYSTETEIAAKEWPSGLYFIRIDDGQRTLYQGKFIKL